MENGIRRDVWRLGEQRSRLFRGFANAAAEQWEMPSGIYDDGSPSWRVEPSEFCVFVEQMFAQPSQLPSPWAREAAGIYESIKREKFVWSHNKLPYPIVWVTRGKNNIKKVNLNLVKCALVILTPLLLFAVLIIVKALNNPPNKIDFFVHRSSLERMVSVVKKSGMKPNSSRFVTWDSRKDSIYRMNCVDDSDPHRSDVYAARDARGNYIVSFVTNVEHIGFGPLSYGDYRIYGYVYADDLSEIAKDAKSRYSRFYIKGKPINNHWWGRDSGSDDTLY